MGCGDPPKELGREWVPGAGACGRPVPVDNVER